MAYISQDDKKALSVGIKKVLKKYGMKGSLSIQNHSTLAIKLSKGKLDLIGNYSGERYKDVPYMNINEYWIEDNYHGETKNFLDELIIAMNESEDGSVVNFDKSDIQSDYFHVGYYISINAGKWNKPYEYIPS